MKSLLDHAAANTPAARRAVGAARPRRRPLRILHVVEAFGGGVFEVLRVLAGDSVTRGHHVGLAYGRRRETPGGLRSRLHPAIELIPTAWQRRSVGAQLRAQAQMRRLVAAWRPDVVHLHSSFAGVIGAATVPREIPTVYTPHAYSFEMHTHSEPRRALFRALEAYVSRRVDMVAAVSPAEARLAKGALRAPRVTVIENGIPELDQGVARHAQPRSRPLTVAMGRIGPQRQPEACARILGALAAASDVRWIGGGAPGSGGARALMRAGVPITGWTPREQALEQLAAADVYLHWTAWDGQPLSVLEAMAREVVVIAHDIAPVRDILHPDQLCRDGEEAVALILRALGDDELKSHLLTLQRARAPRYQARRMLAQWDELYDRLASAARQQTSPWRLQPATTP